MPREVSLLQILFDELKSSITRYVNGTTDFKAVVHSCEILDEYLTPMPESPITLAKAESTISVPEMTLTDAYRILGRDKPPPIPKGHLGASKEMLLYAQKQDALKIARIERLCNLAKQH